ncbi:zinc finger protein 182-like [Achroia grisella]|uniref:zinc finger protein 182-like n=1 Tax=Achroia grisella TaxID=688607 RepID=UPI0027D20484|nr:zinc finger protein 182-like [Achroia grisella]
MDVSKYLNVCATCLSSDRRLIAVKDVRNFMKFSKIKRSDVSVFHICWECDAIVKKIVVFREKAIKAQNIINHIVKANMSQTSIETLSSLIQSEVKMCQVATVDIQNDAKPHSDRSLVEQQPFVIRKDIDAKKFISKVNKDRQTKDITKYSIEHVDCDNLEGDDEEMEKEVDKNEEAEQESAPPSEYDVETINKSQNIFTVRVISEKEMMKFREDRRNDKSFQKCRNKCETCVVYFKGKRILEEHQKKHDKENKFVCTICDQRFPTEAALEYHTQTHYRSYVCQTCYEEFRDEYSVDIHYQDEHDETRHQCGDCDATLPNKRSYLKHRRSVHGKMVACPYCNKMASNSSSLKKHILIHTQAQNLECDICSKKFRTDILLQTHKSTHVYKKDENAYCTECDIQFKTVNIYRVHLRTSLKHVSKQDFRFPCSQCNSRFPTSSYLRAHMRHSHNLGKKYPCTMCDRVFKRNRLLQIHISIKHEGKPRKKVGCHTCNKEFTSKTALRDHMNIHTGNRPYVCKLCEATFSFKASLYTHNKLVHLKNKVQRNDATTFHKAKTTENLSIPAHREILTKDHGENPTGIEEHKQSPTNEKINVYFNDTEMDRETFNNADRHRQTRNNKEKHSDSGHDIEKYAKSPKNESHRVEYTKEQDWIEVFFNK